MHCKIAYGELTIHLSDTHRRFLFQQFAAFTDKWKIHQETGHKTGIRVERGHCRGLNASEVWMLQGHLRTSILCFFLLLLYNNLPQKKKKEKSWRRKIAIFSNTCFLRKVTICPQWTTFQSAATQPQLLCAMLSYLALQSFDGFPAQSWSRWGDFICHHYVQPSLSDCWSYLNNSTGRLWRRKLSSSLCSCAQPSLIRSPNYNHTLQHRHFKGP